MKKKVPAETQQNYGNTLLCGRFLYEVVPKSFNFTFIAVSEGIRQVVAELPGEVTPSKKELWGLILLMQID